MSSKDESTVFPGHISIGPGRAIDPGLTKRELFAAMAMQGVVSNARLKEGITDEEVVKVAVAYADALLSALGGE